MATEIMYTVEGMQCGHCEAALKAELGAVGGVEEIAIDLGTKAVTVRGQFLDDDTLRAAIREAGYEAASSTSPRRV